MRERLLPACRIAKLRKQVGIDAGRLSSETYEKLSLFLEQMTVS